MARKGRVDRGLFLKPDSQGKLKWYVRLYHEGKEQRFGAFPTKTKGREFYEKAKLDQQEGRFFPERYKRAGHAKLKDVIEAYMATNTNKSIRDDWCHANFWLEKFPNCTLKSITPESIERTKRELLNKGLSHQTVVHYLKFLRRIFNVAIKNGKVERNPLGLVEFPKLSNGRLRFLSLEEEGRLCEAIGLPYSQWVRFAILTALRRQEQFSLKWTDLDLDMEPGQISLRETKSGDAQYVELSPEAKMLLKGMTSLQYSNWVFPSKNLRTPLDPHNFYHRIFVPAVKKANLEDVTWHTLRHTFASRLAMRGATERELQEALRHSSTTLVKRYAHLSHKHLAGVMERVSAFGQPVQPQETPTGTVPKTGTVEWKEEQNIV